MIEPKTCNEHAYLILTYNERSTKRVWKLLAERHLMQYINMPPFAFVPIVLNEAQIHYMIQLFKRKYGIHHVQSFNRIYSYLSLNHGFLVF